MIDSPPPHTQPPLGLITTATHTHASTSKQALTMHRLLQRVHKHTAVHAPFSDAQKETKIKKQGCCRTMAKHKRCLLLKIWIPVYPVCYCKLWLMSFLCFWSVSFVVILYFFSIKDHHMNQIQITEIILKIYSWKLVIKMNQYQFL